jgi:hypothetical protein
MSDRFFQAGDRVGIKDSPDFSHWSIAGSVIGAGVGADGLPTINVMPDGETEAVRTRPALLVKIAPGLAEPDCYAQSYPTNGDAPGPLMYFASAADLLAFTHQFQDLKLDEVLKVHAGAAASEAQRSALRSAGATEF